MKKFGFKSLLILVLVLLLAFSLVACGDKDESSSDDSGNSGEVVDPNAIETSAFFDALWKGASSIGAEKISSTDDIAVSLDLSAGISVVDSNSTVSENITVGLAAQIVYDREIEEGGKNNTAAKVKLYNPSTGKNWLTLYYFLNDPYNAYIDFDGQNIAFYFDTTFNEKWPNAIAELLNKDIIGKEGSTTKLSIDDIIQQIAATTGETFDLNKLLKVVLNIVSTAVDFDIEGLLKKLEGVVGSVTDATTGEFILDNVLKSKIVAAFLSNTRCVESDGVKNYSTQIEAKKEYTNGKGTANTILALIPTLKIGGVTLSDVGLTENNLAGTTLGINFGMKNDEIDGFGLSLALKGKGFLDKKSLDNQYLQIDVDINDLSFGKIDATKASDVEAQLGMKKTNYNSDLTFEVKAKVTSSGVTINPGKVNAYSVNAATGVKLDGDLILDVKLSGNVGKESDKTTDKKVYLYAYLAKVENNVESKAVELAYDGNDIILVTDDSVKLNGVSVVETIFDSLGGYIYTEMMKMSDTKVSGEGGFAAKFLDCYLKELGTETKTYEYDATKATNGKIYATLNLDLNNLVSYAFNAINKSIKNADSASTETTTETTTEAYPIYAKNVITIIKDVISAVDTNSGKQLKITLAKSLLSYIQNWFGLGSVSGAGTAEAWYARFITYNQNWVDAFASFGYFEEGTTYQEVKANQVTDMWTIAKAYAEATTDSAKQKVFTDNKAKFSSDATYKVFAAAMDKLDLLFGDRFVTISGTTGHWYEWALNQWTNGDATLSLEDGISLAVNAKLGEATASAKLGKATASAKLWKATASATIEIGMSDTTQTQLSTIYSGLIPAESKAYDFGKITGLVDGDNK